MPEGSEGLLESASYSTNAATTNTVSNPEKFEAAVKPHNSRNKVSVIASSEDTSQ